MAINITACHCKVLLWTDLAFARLNSLVLLEIVNPIQSCKNTGFCSRKPILVGFGFWREGFLGFGLLVFLVKAVFVK